MPTRRTQYVAWSPLIAAFLLLLLPIPASGDLVLDIQIDCEVRHFTREALLANFNPPKDSVVETVGTRIDYLAHMTARREAR